MKRKTLLLLPWLVLLLLVVVAFVPSLTDFNGNQFGTTNNKVVIKSAATITNTIFYNGTDNKTSLDAGKRQTADSAANKSIDWTLRNLIETDGTTVALDWSSGISLSEVSSVTIPMGAWFNTFLDDGASLTAATFLAPTNTADGWAFADAVTNRIRTRLALPIDWDAGTVEMEIRALCTGTNSTTAGTNVVFAVRAAAIGVLDREDSPTFGTIVSVTNHISTNSYIQGKAITLPITVGNSPSTLRSILWELQRWGADTGDTMTNSAVTVVETRIFFRRTTGNTFPTPSP